MEDGNFPTIYGFPGKAKSDVWQNFGFYLGTDGALDKSHAICRICHFGVRYSGNTSNLRSHLRNHRKVIEAGESSGSLINNFSLNRIIKCEALDLESSRDENVVSTGQLSIKNVFSHADRNEVLNTMVGEYLVDNLLPPSVVESQSFINLMNAADPSIKIQSPEYFADSLLCRLYDTYRRELIYRIKLKSSPSASLTTELWETGNKRSYITYYAHVIDTSWNLETYVVSTKPKPDDLRTDIDDVCNLLSIHHPTVVVGDPVVKATSTSGVIIDCLGLVIDRAAEHALRYKSVPDIIECARKIYSMMDESTNGVDKCWISAYDMMVKVLKNKPDTLMGSFQSEIPLIESVVRALKPLKSAAEHMLEQSQTLVSAVLPIMRKLQISLCQNQKEDDAQLEKELKSEIWNGIKKNYQEQKVKDHLLISSLLDPRFKELLFVDVDDLKRTRQRLVRIASDACTGSKRRCKDDGMPDLVFCETPQKKIKKEIIDLSVEEESDDDGDWLSEVVTKKTAVAKEDSMESAQAEVDRYLTVEQTTSQPLVWWSSRETVYPILARVAGQYLCTPATSLPPDRIFSPQNNDLVSRRSILPEDLIDKMVFLNSNYHKLKE